MSDIYLHMQYSAVYVIHLWYLQLPEIFTRICIWLFINLSTANSSPSINMHIHLLPSFFNIIFSKFILKSLPSERKEGFWVPRTHNSKECQRKPFVSFRTLQCFSHFLIHIFWIANLRSFLLLFHASFVVPYYSCLSPSLPYSPVPFPHATE